MIRIKIDKTNYRPRLRLRGNSGSKNYDIKK